MMRKLLIVLALLIAATVVWAGDSGQIVVAWSMASMEVQSYQVAKQAVELYASKFNAKVLWTDAHNDVTKETNDVENLLAQKPDVIIIHPVDATASAPLVAKAKAQGIPVVDFQRPINSNEFDVFVGGGTYIEGMLQGDFVANSLHGKGRVAIIEGDIGNNNAKNIAKGNKDSLKKYPGIQIVADQASPMWARDKAMNLAENILASNNNNIDAFIVANDDMAGGVSQVLQSKDLPNIIVVGGDGDRDAMQRIMAGTQTGTVVQSFIELPRKALQVAAGLARKEIDPKSFKKEPIFFDPVGSPVPIVTEPYVFISKKNIGILQKYWADCDALLK